MTDWADICNRIAEDAQERGVEALGRDEQAIFLVNDFAFELDNGGLLQYLENAYWSPPVGEPRDWRTVRMTIEALRALGRQDFARALADALSLVEQARWGDGVTLHEWIARIDPASRLTEIQAELTRLERKSSLWDDIEAAALALGT